MIGNRKAMFRWGYPVHGSIKYFRWARCRQLHEKSHDELRKILKLSDALIHQNPSVPFNKTNIFVMERCLRCLARYMADLQKGKISPLLGPQGPIDDDRVRQITNLLWSRIKDDSQKRSDNIVSGRIYSHVIDIFARLGRATEAEEILKEMVSWAHMNPISSLNLNKKGDFDNLRTALFGTVINAYAKMEPTTALSMQGRRSGKNNSMGMIGLARAEALLQYQLQLYHKWNKPLQIKPNIICFTAILDAYSRKADGSRAEAILQDILNHGIVATTITYNVVIAAWSRASILESTRAIQSLDDLPARKAERVLSCMEDWSKGQARPDVVSYTSGKS
jgi:pentatricopeptide repeat protein